jgi:hypothetical protein
MTLADTQELHNVMKISFAATLASLLFAGNALAADGFRIESEAQFVKDYGDQIEQVASGVYQVVRGPLAGKTITIGETGLAYDLAALRAQTPRSRQERAQLKAEIRRLETARTRFSTLREHQARDLTKQSASGAFPCIHYDWWSGNSTWYSGSAQVSATTEFYKDDGGGGLNFYYARASAIATGIVFRPYNVPQSLTMTAYAFAKNHYTGQTVERYGAGINSAEASTGDVYSGPEFSHHLTATARITGVGDCFGYVSISDAMQ